MYADRWILSPLLALLAVSCVTEPGVEPVRPRPSGGAPVVIAIPDPAKRAHRQVKPTRLDGTVTVDRKNGSFWVQPPVWVRSGQIAGQDYVLQIQSAGANLGVVLFELQNHGVHGTDLIDAFEQMQSRNMIEGKIVWR